MGGETRRIHTTPIPPGRRGRSNSRVYRGRYSSCSHAENDGRKTKLVQRDETAERCLDTPQDRSQRPLRTTCDRVAVRVPNGLHGVSRLISSSVRSR
jgi:hypothetical protein